MRAHRQSTSASWPFWLLIAAWVCANVPSTATVHAFIWMKGAGHFSHYAELRQNVASLLTGHPQGVSARVVAAETARQSLPLSLPAESTVKKIDLALTPAMLRVIATHVTPERSDFSARPPAGPVADVPYPPPRSCGQV